MEVVIVPLHRRAAFALACLSRLYVHAQKDDSLVFHLAIDANPTFETVDTARKFARQVGHDRVTLFERTRTFRGNSFNLLTAYAEAAERDADVIHLVEEDVLVADDYFDYHRQVRAVAPDVFAVCGCRNQNWPLDAGPPAEEDAFYLQTSYQSIGVSFTPDKLARITEHNPQVFCNNPPGYIARRFPHSQIGLQFTEQDGLIHRIIEETGEQVAFPCVPRAYHAGFTGYNRPGVTLPGTVEEQAHRILSMTSEDLNATARSYKDYEAIDLETKRRPITRSLTWF